MTTDKIAMNDDQLDAISGGTMLPYRVQPGDSLAAIAAKYHVSVEELARWNNIKDPSMIAVGQQIKVKF